MQFPEEAKDLVSGYASKLRRADIDMKSHQQVVGLLERHLYVDAVWHRKDLQTWIV